LNQKFNYQIKIIYYFFLKDPFENLNKCFKSDAEVRINLNFDKPLISSLAFICYQIIEFVLSALNEDELNNYDQAMWVSFMIDIYIFILELIRNFVFFK
jgi:hypothetical protein